MIVKAFAKINLSIDVYRVQPNGMHPVDMVMHGITLCDLVEVSENPGTGEIKVITGRTDLPEGRENIAYRAAEAMLPYASSRKSPEKDAEKNGTDITIKITKNIPMAAGLAGGSADGGAVILALAYLWDLDLELELKDLLGIGASIGSDVPFCMYMQIAGNEKLKERFGSGDKQPTCFRAQGTGTELTPLPSWDTPLVLIKPAVSVSTKEAYEGMDRCQINERPDNEKLALGLREKDYALTAKEMINVMENYTLAEVGEAAKAKMDMERICEGAIKVLMTGSGPTIFALTWDEATAAAAKEKLEELGYEAYCCRTLI